MAKKTKKKAKATKKASKKVENIQVAVASRVKEVVKGAGMRADGTLPDAVNAKVVAMLNDAVERAQSNNRSTVRPHDL
jgi:histone H3/H4